MSNICESWTKHNVLLSLKGLSNLGCPNYVKIEQNT